jgi:hypothetical protein
MSFRMTQDAIEHLHETCRTALATELFHAESDSTNALRLELATFVAAVAWKVLLPFCISVTGGLTARGISMRISSRSASEVESDVKRTVGSLCTSDLGEKREECVIAIEDLLGPFAIRREQAERIYDLLLDDLTKAAG